MQRDWYRCEMCFSHRTSPKKSTCHATCIKFIRLRALWTEVFLWYAGGVVDPRFPLKRNRKKSLAAKCVCTLAAHKLRVARAIKCLPFGAENCAIGPWLLVELLLEVVVEWRGASVAAAQEKRPCRGRRESIFAIILWLFKQPDGWMLAWIMSVTSHHATKKMHTAAGAVCAHY